MPTQDVECAPVAAAVTLYLQQSGDTWYGVAKRMGWTVRRHKHRASGGFIGGDSSRLRRRLGLAENRGRGQTRRKQKFMTYATAEKIIAACPGVDPVDVGI